MPSSWYSERTLRRRESKKKAKRHKVEEIARQAAVTPPLPQAEADAIADRLVAGLLEKDAPLPPDERALVVRDSASKMLIVDKALRDGMVAASERFEVPYGTIRGWLSDPRDPEVLAVRARLESEMRDGIMRVAHLALAELAKRLADPREVSTRDLIVSAGVMIDKLLGLAGRRGPTQVSVGGENNRISISWNAAPGVIDVTETLGSGEGAPEAADA